MPRFTLTRAGLIGAIFAIVCCLGMPALFLLGGLSLSSLFDNAAVILIPVLLIFAGLLVYAVRRERRQSTSS